MHLSQHTYHMLYHKLLLTFQSYCAICVCRQSSRQLFRRTSKSPPASHNEELIANTLEMFYLCLSLSLADFYLKLSILPQRLWSGGLSSHFVVILFLMGAHSSVAESKAAPWQSVRGYDKKPGNKEPLCNLMCPESGLSVHFNEQRSPFSKRGAGGHGNTGLFYLKKNTHAHFHCVVYM